MSIKSLELDITSPVKFNTTIEYNEISIFVGKNGIGKTFILKLVWALSNVFNGVIFAHQKGAMVTTKETAQFFLDNTFDNQDINGKIKLNLKDGSLIINMDKGKVIDSKYVLPMMQLKDYEPLPATFMSKTSRTYSDLIQYLKFKDMMGITNIGKEEEMKKVLKMYKLYDVLFFEKSIIKYSAGFNMPPNFLKKLQDDFEINRDIQTIKIDNLDVVYIDSTGKQTSMSILSAGEQSLINILIANL